MSIEEKLITIAENEQKVFDAGKKKQYDEFWNIFQDYGKRNHYVNAFSYSFWKDTIYNPKYPINAQVYGLEYTFSNSSITDTKVPVSVHSKMVGSFVNSGIITIRKLILNNVTTITNPFGGCTKLKNIVVEGEWQKSIDFKDCPLTTDSIVSIVEALSGTIDETTGENTVTGQTLTLKKASVEAMIFPFVSEQSGITYSSWDNLRNTKTNWTISLV